MNIQPREFPSGWLQPCFAYIHEQGSFDPRRARKPLSGQSHSRTSPYACIRAVAARQTREVRQQYREVKLIYEWLL